MTTKKVSLNEIDDDNSSTMTALITRFEEMYGEELDEIIAESIKHGKPYNEIED